MKAAALFLVSTLYVFPAASAQSQHPAPPNSKSQKAPAASTKAEPSTCGTQAADPQQLEALQSDLKKMRGLLAQMQTNLAFVQNAPTPLKHQFELEIDMWRALLDHMERQVDIVSEKSGSPH